MKRSKEKNACIMLQIIISYLKCEG
jgi:hypothetical protein